LERTDNSGCSAFDQWLIVGRTIDYRYRAGAICAGRERDRSGGLGGIGRGIAGRGTSLNGADRRNERASQSGTKKTGDKLSKRDAQVAVSPAVVAGGIGENRDAVTGIVP
jgi:hypothetical protein